MISDRDILLDKYKQSARKNWGGAPCGINTVHRKYELMSKRYFYELDRKRDIEEPWLQDELYSMKNYISGRKVLEIGYGQGRDHIKLARLGGDMSGIDITPSCKVFTEAHLKAYDLTSDLVVGDAEKLPYQDNSFDFVYSFGVLHHTSNMERAISEIRRVLKPNGKCWIGLYNKNSFFYWGCLIPEFFIKKEYMSLSLRERLSLIEYPNNNKDLMVRLTTKKELKEIFKEERLQIESIKTRSLNRESFLIGGSIVPQRLLEKLGRYVGWYNIVVARKL